MEPITSAVLHAFFQQLSERYSGEATLYLLGGSALCLLGNPRVTQDVDYTFEVDAESIEQFRVVVTELANEMRLDLEAVPLAEFVPLPPQAYERLRRELSRAAAASRALRPTGRLHLRLVQHRIEQNRARVRGRSRRCGLYAACGVDRVRGIEAIL